MTLHTMSVLARLVLASSLMVLLVGCSYVYDVSFTVGIPAGTTATVVVEVVDAQGMTDRNTVTPTASQTVVMSTVSVCCAPEPVVTMQAFLDLNNNVSHDAGEPLQVWQGGAMTLIGPVAVQLHLAPAPAPVISAPTAAEL